MQHVNRHAEALLAQYRSVTEAVEGGKTDPMMFEFMVRNSAHPKGDECLSLFRGGKGRGGRRPEGPDGKGAWRPGKGGGRGGGLRPGMTLPMGGPMPPWGRGQPARAPPNPYGPQSSRDAPPQWQPQPSRREPPPPPPHRREPPSPPAEDTAGQELRAEREKRKDALREARRSLDQCSAMARELKKRYEDAMGDEARAEARSLWRRAQKGERRALKLEQEAEDDLEEAVEALERHKRTRGAGRCRGKGAAGARPRPEGQDSDSESAERMSESESYASVAGKRDRGSSSAADGKRKK